MHEVGNDVVGKADAKTCRDTPRAKTARCQNCEIPAESTNLDLCSITFQQVALYGDSQNLGYGTKLQIDGLFSAEGLAVSINAAASSQEAIARVFSGTSELALVDINTLADGELRNNQLKRALTWNADGVSDFAMTRGDLRLVAPRMLEDIDTGCGTVGVLFNNAVALWEDKDLGCSGARASCSDAYRPAARAP